MNIITLIQTALTALVNDSGLFLLDRSEAESNELNHTSSVVIVYPDWTEKDTPQNFELLVNRSYNMVFKMPDEWDNSTGQTVTSYEAKTSVDRIEEMSQLANSVFMYLYNNMDTLKLRSISWNKPKPVLRANLGTMSGVEIKLDIEFTGEFNCR